MKTKREETIKVAYNPTTRRYERVYNEDEVIGNKIITLYWSVDRYVTIPES